MDSTDMREHILKQGRAAKMSLDHNREAVEGFAAQAEFDRIIVNGAGDKYLIGLTAGYLWREFGREPLTVLHSRDLADNPPHMDENTLVIFLSQSGKTKDTMDAAKLVAGRGCSTALITNLRDPEPDSLWFLKKHGPVFSTRAEIYPERPTPSTLTFHGTLSVLWHVLAELAGKSLYQELQDAAEVTHQVSNDLAVEQGAKSVATKLSGMGPRYVFGDGPRYGLARKQALIMFMEGTKVNAFSLESEEFLHSAVETLEEVNKQKLPMLMFMPPKGAAFRDIAEKTVNAWSEHAPAFPISPQEVSRHPRLNNLLSVQPQMVFGEWVAYHEALLRGIDPGLTEIVKKVRSKGF